MDIIVTGQIVQALPVQQGVSQRTGNAWQRASYIIEHEHGQYPKRMVFDVSNAKIQELNIQIGEMVTLHLNISCREFPENSGKWFNSIEAWKVERGGQQQMQQGYQQQPQYQQPQYQQQAQSPLPPQQPQYQQPAPGTAPFPPQVNAQGQPVQPQQQGAPQNGKLPF